MDARTRRIAFCDAQRAVRLADMELTAALAVAGEETVLAIGVDELQAVQFRAVAHRHDERTFVQPQAMRPDPFADQIRMVIRRRQSRLPDRPRFLAGLGLAPGVLGLPLAPHRLDARAMRGFFLWGQSPPDVRPPGLGRARAPVAEGPGGDAVVVQHIPARIIAALALACEAMQPAIRLDDFRRRQAGTVDRGAELLDVFAHRRTVTPRPCGSPRCAAPASAGFLPRSSRRRARPGSRA